MALPKGSEPVYIARVQDSRKQLVAELLALPRRTDDIAPVEGTLKRTPEDFVVEELPAYLPSGSGEHLYLWIEKRGINTQDAVARLARVLGARADGAGYAGLKDRQAVTRQWVSFHHGATPAAEAIAADGVRVLQIARHGNKLRTGHLRGNRFTIRLADVPVAHDARADAALARLAETGLPNYFGSQRFGRDGQNLETAFAWIVDAGPPPKQPFLRKLMVSTLQAALFNAWLAARLRDGRLDVALGGDVLRKEDTGGLFTSVDPETDTARIARWEISPTGPMFGARMRAAEGEAGAIEADLLARHGITSAHLARVARAGEGTRRPARVAVSDTEVRREGTDLVLSFSLPKGSYATVLLSELTKRHDLTLGDGA